MPAQEQKLIATAQKLQTQVDSFRTKKETMKATYTAAEAQTKIGEAVSGISESMSDAGMSMQRAQDKIDGMQARAGAMDELLASGALTDLTNPVDDIQAQLDKASTTSTVDAELAALKAEVGSGCAPGPRARGGGATRPTRSHRRDRPDPGRGAVHGPRRAPGGARPSWTTPSPRPSTTGTRTGSPRPWRPSTAEVRSSGVSPWPTTPSPPPTWWSRSPTATLEETRALLAEHGESHGGDDR